MFLFGHESIKGGGKRFFLDMKTSYEGEDVDTISRANRLLAFLIRMYQWFQVWQRELRRSGEEIIF